MSSGKCPNTKNVRSPILSIPIISSKTVHYRIPKRVEVYEYFAIANGNSRIFGKEDWIEELGKQVILDPYKVSFINLFINGVLQSNESYIVRKGELELLTLDVPIQGSPVILQMIKV
ncbi:DUF4183 domain-containing protein [Metabacillus fastidiosus]|uniref:DUF4183 domain-containing protein n=1 Tax=Metabacillus fastidiosus TaxID=1458 RepID=UPI002E2321BF|nr:DUF4183 domain-containing protein [Metabacillus fastidiosus]